MKVLIIGDRPSAKMKKGAKPFEGASCEKRLNSWMTILGLNDKNYQVQIINQVDYGISNGKNILILMDMKNLDLLMFNKNKTKFIALGNKASERLSKANVGYFKLPHPSGRNRQLNDPKFIEQKLQECKQWLIK